ncbi:hypothetical protein LCGC14_1819910 [marine sediment metagenome]|uniref:Lipoprotein n=1 Tax=marine sediment metagenome TaxID=412755 RepID=A0A0F9H7E5_9ZZZZ
MNIRITYFSIFLILCSCSEPSYQITLDGINRDKPIQDGFHLTEIYVTEFNEEGRPTKYTDGISVFCGPAKGFSVHLGEKEYNQKEKMKQNRVDLSRITNMPLNKILK